VMEISSADERLPLFVKDGSVLPLATPTLHTEDPVSRQLEVRIYGDGSLPAALLEESEPGRPFDERGINRLELSWHPGRGEIVSRRARSDLSPFYSVATQIRVT
jgi:hypothetical protein